MYRLCIRRPNGFHGGPRDVTDRIVTEIASREQVDVAVLPTLHERVDVDALVMLFEDAGYTVGITGTRTVQIDEEPVSW